MEYPEGFMALSPIEQAKFDYLKAQIEAEQARGQVNNQNTGDENGDSSEQ